MAVGGCSVRKGKARGATRLTEAQRAVAEALPLEVDGSRVRLYQAGCGRGAGWLRRFVLCASGGRAVTLGNHVILPDRCEGDSALLAHELTHCGQYQQWGAWQYFTRGAVVQLRALAHRLLRVGGNPYTYQPEPGKPFEAYGMEQQGQIVEDYFRALAVKRFRRPDPSDDDPPPRAACLPIAQSRFRPGLPPWP